MSDREFTEIELRRMLGRAQGFHPDIIEGRWVIEARHKRAAWEVIVEPDEPAKLQVVVTAYPVERRNS